jgi:hypothetical protein
MSVPEGKEEGSHHPEENNNPGPKITIRQPG